MQSRVLEGGGSVEITTNQCGEGAEDGDGASQLGVHHN